MPWLTHYKKIKVENKLQAIMQSRDFAINLQT